jgi:alkanesulfonate monooxygenase SsuD/methylene tetrahydromethanopterin reductase-like flavin-dependent oxidoreductase (luciferase family)
VSAAFSRIHRLAERAGRDPSEIGLAYNSLTYREPEPDFLPSGDRRRFTGSPEQIAADIREWEELGASYLMLSFHRDFATDTLEQILESMERFTTKIKPLV